MKKVKRLLTCVIVLALFCSFSICVSADNANGKCGENVSWEFDASTGVLSITGSGAMSDYSGGALPPWYASRSYIKSVVISSGVTSIGGDAFTECDGLTSVTIPDSVTSIGYSAFASSGLTSVVIPGSVTTMKSGAFSYCSALTSVTILDGVTTIGENAFDSCSGLTSVTIPDSVTTIADYAFYGCSGLTSITIPDGVTTIGEYAFRNCSGLTNIVIPAGVTSIKTYSFYGCGLTSIVIPDSVTAIEDWAFGSCTSLTDTYYLGTQTQWESISISNGNDALKSNVHYNSKHLTCSFEWDQTDYNPGDTATAAVKLSGTAGTTLAAYSLKLADVSGMTLTAITPTAPDGDTQKTEVNKTTGSIAFSITGTNEIDLSGKTISVFTLTYTVNEDAAAGKAVLDAAEFEAYHSDGSALESVQHSAGEAAIHNIP